MEIAMLFGIGVCIVILISLNKDSGKNAEMIARLSKIEHIIQSLGVNMQLNQLENTFNTSLKEQQEAFMKSILESGGKVFRTKDGKFAAGSIEELFNKITNDPESTIDPEELATLKNFFEQILIEEADEEDEALYP